MKRHKKVFLFVLKTFIMFPFLHMYILSFEMDCVKVIV